MSANAPHPETGPRLLFVGDSHVQYFRIAGESGLFSPWLFASCEVSGATAAGLRNPDSFTAASKKFLAFLGRHDPADRVVFHLGEVDCGILVWKRAAERRIPLEGSLALSVQAYFDFIDEVRTKGFLNLVMTGATLPTITDNDRLGKVVNSRRRLVTATHAERTELTLRFNAMLEREARDRGIPYVDVRDAVLDPETKLVCRSFRNSDPSDHHMDATRAAGVWAAALQPVLGAQQR